MRKIAWNELTWGSLNLYLKRVVSLGNSFPPFGYLFRLFFKFDWQDYDFIVDGFWGTRYDINIIISSDIGTDITNVIYIVDIDDDVDNNDEIIGRYWLSRF